ncbi:hypothetical protein OSC27_11200 [Microbacterium sp. STN6]|uniref:hypothetical protein n=1 Tax=Microbacterium sp. STN6 TaxID=2995588 RepID=UPI00226088C1|nr:hypothetical protein [Microbacterium sp. STN6]MCX7522841.1 hypothetical protein [Microbacterium sp. STN6]
MSGAGGAEAGAAGANAAGANAAGALPPEPALAVAVIDANGTPHADHPDFRIELSSTPAEPGTRVVVRVRYVGARPLAAGIRVSASLASDDPWWLIPGLFYGENRPAANTRRFPRFEIGAFGAEAAAALVSSSWEFRADRAATPAVFVWAGPGRGGLALAAAESSPLGITGVGLAHESARAPAAETAPATETAPADGTATAHLTFPYREAPVTYYGDERARQADVATHLFSPGDAVELTLRVFDLAPDRHAYAPILRTLHAESAASAPLNPWVDVPHAADLAAEGLLRWHYDPDPGVLLETVGFDRGVSGRDGKNVDRQAMHVGWVSGIPWAYALLQHGLRVGADAEVTAARRVIDFITATLSPSGTFWGVWYRDSGWSQSWTEIKRGLHSRTLGEATLFLVRAAALEASQAPARADAAWERAIRSNLDTVVARQRADGNLGSIHHAETGEVLSWQGAAGLMWIPALVEAGDRDERYLPAALAAGRYYVRFVEQEFIHGAPEDVDLAPTSEDGYAAIMAYMALHRATGDAAWLDLARRAADWMLTFRYTYNVSFEPTTLLGTYDFRSRGADQASPSNQHLHAYGLVCTDELHELARATGDPHYAERANETLECFRQFIARDDGDFNAYRGMVSERFYQTECFQPKGMLLTLSHAWSVGVLLLACEQTLARNVG